MFSKTFGHALRAATYVFMNARGDKKISLAELSHQLEIPHHFLGKIMQDLVRHGIIDSIKGPSGGFFCNERTGQVVLTDILKITDGSLVFEQCALGLRKCNPSHPCLLHRDFGVCRDGMLSVLAVKTLHDMVNSVEAGLGFLV